METTTRFKSNYKAEEVTFFRKANKATYPWLSIPNSEPKLNSSQKHLQLIFDNKLTKWHKNGKIHQANKDVGLSCKIATILPHTSLLTIYNSFIKPLLDYEHVI